MKLDDVRINIDDVDTRLKQLIEERMKLSSLVAAAKLETGDNIFKPEREQAIISKLTSDTNPDICKQYTALIKKIMLVSREYQYKITLDSRDDFPLAIKSDNCDTHNLHSETICTNFDDTLAKKLLEERLYLCDIKPANGSDYNATLCNTLIGNDSTSYIMLMISGRDYSSSLPGILGITADYNATLHSIRTNSMSCFIELNAGITNPDIMAMLYMLLNEYKELHIVGSY